MGSIPAAAWLCALQGRRDLPLTRIGEPPSPGPNSKAERC